VSDEKKKTEREREQSASQKKVRRKEKKKTLEFKKHTNIKKVVAYKYVYQRS
jgi:hypothetical protein